MDRIYIKLAIATMLIFSNSCIDRNIKHGYIFDESKSKFLRKGISSKKEVYYIMGSPSIDNHKLSNSWVYLAQDIKKVAFLKPKIVNRKILIINFSDDDIIKQTNILTLNDSQKINPYPKYTKVEGHKEPGFIKAIFSNIGQVSPN